MKAFFHPPVLLFLAVCLVYTSLTACEEESSPTIVTEVDTVVVTTTDTLVVNVVDTIIRVDTVQGEVVLDTIIVNLTKTVEIINSGVLEGTFRDLYDMYCLANRGLHQGSLQSHWAGVTNLLEARIGQGPDPLNCREAPR